MTLNSKCLQQEKIASLIKKVDDPTFAGKLIYAVCPQARAYGLLNSLNPQMKAPHKTNQIDHYIDFPKVSCSFFSYGKNIFARLKAELLRMLKIQYFKNTKKYINFGI